MSERARICAQPSPQNPRLPLRAEARVFIPIGVILGRDSRGKEITVDACIRDNILIDQIVPETLTQAGCDLLARTRATITRGIL